MPSTYFPPRTAHLPSLPPSLTSLQGLSREDMAIYEQLCTLVNRSDNHKAMRAALRNTTGPTIPFLGACTRATEEERRDGRAPRLSMACSLSASHPPPQPSLRGVLGAIAPLAVEKGHVSPPGVHNCHYGTRPTGVHVS